MDNPDGYEFKIKSMVLYLLDWTRNCEFAPCEVAKAAGITQSAVFTITKNKEWNPQVRTLVGIARAHDVLCARQRAYDE